jgi:tetratricopeptide (TPR) repeat protein
MAGDGELDAFGCAERTGVIRLFLLLLLLPAISLAQTVAQAAQSGAQTPALSGARELYTKGKYKELVEQFPASPANPPEIDLYRGLALAKLKQWQEAKAAFEAGRAKQPRNQRFLVELAGVDFEQRHYDRAKERLREALAVKPDDRYARNFLATIYLLTHNLHAAIYNLNKIGKPYVNAIEMEPTPKLRNTLLQRSFAFSPLETLRLKDLYTTEARLDNLDLFPRYRFDLVPNQNGTYSVDFLSIERNGWGASKLEALASLLRDLPTAVDPEYYNVNNSGINLRSYFRWNENLRRVWASFSMPLEQNPSQHFSLYTDARNENWDLSRTFTGSTTPLIGLNLERIEFGPELRVIESGRWGWQAQLLYAYRRFRNVRDVTSSASFFFADGSSIEYRMRVEDRLLRMPDRRLNVDSWLQGTLGRNFASGLGDFGALEGSIELKWFPRPVGDDYQTSLRFRAGRLFGPATLDELYELGVEHDNNLWVRGIPGIRHGMKGNAPLGRQFVLWNWETDKTVYNSLYLHIQFGPFMDIGHVSDPSGDFGSHAWLVDPGFQCRFRLFGDVVVLVSYGRDLHSGSSTFYETATH